MTDVATATAAATAALDATDRVQASIAQPFWLMAIMLVVFSLIMFGVLVVVWQKTRQETYPAERLRAQNEDLEKAVKARDTAYIDLQATFLKHVEESQKLHRDDIEAITKLHREELQRAYDQGRTDIARFEEKTTAMMQSMTLLREECEERDSLRQAENTALWSMMTPDQRLSLKELGFVPGVGDRRHGNGRRRDDVRPTAAAEVTHAG